MDGFHVLYEQIKEAAELRNPVANHRLLCCRTGAFFAVLAKRLRAQAPRVPPPGSPPWSSRDAESARPRSKHI